MPIRLKTKQSDIHNYVRKWYQNVIKSLQEAMEKTCREAVNKAKEIDTYKDQTNNLRSSIGYVLYYNGEEVSSAFAKSGEGKKGDGASGIQKGRDVALEIAKKYSRGFVGVVVAGEDYAAAVEAGDKDVITGSIQRFSYDLQKNLEDVNSTFGTSFQQVR
jgi:hypothetical protein